MPYIFITQSSNTSNFIYMWNYATFPPTVELAVGWRKLQFCVKLCYTNYCYNLTKIQFHLININSVTYYLIIMSIYSASQITLQLSNQNSLLKFYKEEEALELIFSILLLSNKMQELLSECTLLLKRKIHIPLR